MKEKTAYSRMTPGSRANVQAVGTKGKGLQEEMRSGPGPHRAVARKGVKRFGRMGGRRAGKWGSVKLEESTASTLGKVQDTVYANCHFIPVKLKTHVGLRSRQRGA